MAVNIPHIEDSTMTSYLPPKGDFEGFVNDSHYEEKVREWGLCTTKEVKKEFWYKENTHQRLVTLKGYEVYGKDGEYNTIVIEFQDGNVSCIHPAYLKEMQSPNFGKVSLSSDTSVQPTATQIAEKPKAEVQKEKTVSPKKEQATTTKSKSEKKPKLELPEEKVHFTAKVRQFAYSWNHFNEENDEVVVLEDVMMVQEEEPVEVGLAWCSHSKTLKKLELTPGDLLEFDGKIIKKKLAKGKDVEEEFMIEDAVPYKVNNPSKIKKS